MCEETRELRVVGYIVTFYQWLTGYIIVILYRGSFLSPLTSRPADKEKHSSTVVRYCT